MLLADIKTYLTEWVYDYCKNDFNPDADNLFYPYPHPYIRTGTKYPLPLGVQIFIDQAAQFLISQSGKTSESLGDYSVSFGIEFPKSLLDLLKPYKKIGVL
jgi:hypothetical protein